MNLVSLECHPPIMGGEAGRCKRFAAENDDDDVETLLHRCPSAYDRRMTTEDNRSLLQVLLQPDMIKLFLASLFILSQVLISFSLIPLYISHRGGTTFTIGMQTTVFAVASVVLRFIFGPMADSRGRKFVLALGAFAFSSAQVLIYLSPDFTWMLLARVYQAIGMASYLATASSLVVDLSPVAMRGSVIGTYRMITPFASLIGPYLGNVVINIYGFAAFFAATAGTAFAAFLLVLSLKAGRRTVGGEITRIRVGDVLGLFRIPDLQAAYLGVLLVAVGGGVVNTFVTSYGNPYFRNPGAYFTVYAGVGAVAAFLLGRLSDRAGRRGVAIPVVLAMAAGTAILPMIDHAPTAVYVLSAVGTGIGFNAGLSVLISWIVDVIPDTMRATALSIQESWIDGGFAIGIFLFGTLSVIYGQGRLFLFTGVFVAVGAFAIVAMSSFRRRRSAEEEMS
ncbi:MAG: MFS transporter [Alkalispirochaeta sp.]